MGTAAVAIASGPVDRAHEGGGQHFRSRRTRTHRYSSYYHFSYGIGRYTMARGDTSRTTGCGTNCASDVHFMAHSGALWHAVAQ